MKKSPIKKQTKYFVLKWGKRIREILNEEGRGEKWITEIERVRRERSTSEGEERGKGDEQE